MTKEKRLPKKELKKFKDMLLKERTRMLGGLTQITENTLKKSPREATGDLSGYSYHMADQASDDYDVEFSLGRATEDQRFIFLIDESLKRISDGTYGLCTECSKPIAKKRLAALPYAEVCIACQRKNDDK